MNLEEIKENYGNMDWEDFRDCYSEGMLQEEMDIYDKTLLEDVPALIAEVERLRNIEQSTHHYIEEIQQFAKERKKSYESYGELHEKYSELYREKHKVEYENKRLREALEFYADAENHIPKPRETLTLIDEDYGIKARQALEK